ncbi:hypothetical protein psal_cds_1302 [Pandoravirus salinus]|uniref:Uncharacterized protein n=1 Tax=Pandoravirus salinus TaxID=1349410 RepID=A0A291ATX4_9VIRU|nr:hypothetical protein psal_cds_1302 [Pandoravirus salinus]ATE82304.1 hypothetical protein psal_cds_1302 [Pandoravirus salinus]
MQPGVFNGPQRDKQIFFFISIKQRKSTEIESSKDGRRFSRCLPFCLHGSSFRSSARGSPAIYLWSDTHNRRGFGSPSGAKKESPDANARGAIPRKHSTTGSRTD